MALRRAERRLYPWRAKLTAIACEGSLAAPHLPATYVELEQPDPVAAPYEWRCPRCDVVKPSVAWDPKVPVPPHEFTAPPGDIYCRVCLRFSDDRMWHPEPARAMFDPVRIATIDPTLQFGNWCICIDETLGVLEAYVAQTDKRVAISRETFDILTASDDALLRFMDDTIYADGPAGMRFLDGIPIYEQAVRAYRAERNEDVVVAKDEITQLSEVAQSLAVQAVSLGANGAEDHQQILMGRYLAARTRANRLYERLAVLDAELELAALAVME